MTVTKRTRYEVLRRDENTCRYCHATDSPLTVDHVIPVALGGSDDPSNLVAACKDCNAGKTSSSPDAPLVAQVADDAIRWAAAMRAASTSALELLAEDESYADQLDDLWSRWSYGPRELPIPRPDDWRRSASQWRAAGLPIELLLDAAERSLSNTLVRPDGTWKYCCGIAWRRIKELQTAARDLLSDDVDDELDCSGHTTCDCEAAAYQTGHGEGRWETAQRPEYALSVFQYVHLAAVADRLDYNLAHV